MGNNIETFDHLQDGYLPGWPGRTQYMSTSAGTQILHFVPGGDQEVPITETYSVILKAEKRCNYLLGQDEKGGYEGDLEKYYPDFLYNVLGDAQKRVIDCIRQGKRFI